MRPQKKICLALGLVLLLAIPMGRAQAPTPSESQVKVAFLYNFAKFIDWPPETFPSDKSPFIIGILGDNSFSTMLEKMVAGRNINDRPIVVQTIETSDGAITNCHILFISNSEKKHYAELIQKLHGACVLTVSEADGFLAAGGMVNFVRSESKIRFQINNETAKAARLRISAKLLSLAVHNSG